MVHHGGRKVHHGLWWLPRSDRGGNYPHGFFAVFVKAFFMEFKVMFGMEIVFVLLMGALYGLTELMKVHE